MTPERPRFFGTHFRKFAVAGFELSLSRASVPKEDLPEHHHDDAHFIFAIDAGYLSRAFGRGEQGRGLDLIYNPPGTEHRDCFDEPNGRFLSAVGNARREATAWPRLGLLHRGGLEARRAARARGEEAAAAVRGRGAPSPARDRPGPMAVRAEGVRPGRRRHRVSHPRPGGDRRDDP